MLSSIHTGQYVPVLTGSHAYLAHWAQTADFFTKSKNVTRFFDNAASDADRILPGDGDLPLAKFVRKLCQLGYEGHVSLEMMNPMLWQVKTHQVFELGYTAVQRTLESK